MVSCFYSHFCNCGYMLNSYLSLRLQNCQPLRKRKEKNIILKCTEIFSLFLRKSIIFHTPLKVKKKKNPEASMSAYECTHFFEKKGLCYFGFKQLFIKQQILYIFLHSLFLLLCTFDVAFALIISELIEIKATLTARTDRTCTG